MKRYTAIVVALGLVVALTLKLGLLMLADPMPLPPHFGPTPVPQDVRYWVRLDCCPARVSREPVYVSEPCYHP